MMIIGITGHRNIKKQCLPYYKMKIHDLLVLLKEKHRELLIYSAIAEGADRLVVEVAIEMNIEYVVVLPMPQSLYAIDFCEASKEIFLTLLHGAKGKIEIPMVKENTLSSVAADSCDRDLQYEAAGHFVSDHCDTLIALWDGKYSQFRGGTSETVKYYLAKTHYSLYYLPVSRSGELTNNMIEFIHLTA